MRLFGYRRFVEATINLDAKMVAVLGPNESGKSSLLDALELFNDQNRVPSAAIHRDVSVDDSTVIGELVFRLSAGEREEFPYEVPDTQGLWLRVSKQVGGTLSFSFEPALSRPFQARQAAQKAVAQATDSPWFRQLKASEDDDEEEPLTGVLSDLADEISSTAQALSRPVVERLEAAIARLADFDTSSDSATSQRAIAALLAKLEVALGVERLPSTQRIAAQLGMRRPLCHMFDDENRTLEFRHDITNDDTYSRAFHNLADLGGLDIGALSQAITEDAAGRKRTLLNDAVQRINRRYSR